MEKNTFYINIGIYIEMQKIYRWTFLWSCSEIFLAQSRLVACILVATFYSCFCARPIFLVMGEKCSRRLIPSSGAKRNKRAVWRPHFKGRFSQGVSLSLQRTYTAWYRRQSCQATVKILFIASQMLTPTHKNTCCCCCC